MLQVIDAETVRRVLTYDLAVPAMARALVAESAGEGYGHPRIEVAPPNLAGDLLVMPASTPSGATLITKLLTLFEAAPQKGLPAVQGVSVVFDGATGEPLAVIDGAAVTEIRTAATTAAATDRLARADARTLAMIGAGVQGRSHLLALRDLRPWSEVRVVSRSRVSAERLAEWAHGEGIEVTVAGSVAEAVADADVVCTVTSSQEPIVDRAMLAPGVHVNAVGAHGAEARELATDVVAGAAVFVDGRGAALRETGDVLIPINEGAFDPSALVEAGKVLAGEHPGRINPDQVTVFTSVGLPLEDAIACELIVQALREPTA
jgi:ornithine cyclodeaminase/alanine dehydrogenase-like protein (mu-crystallin family)